MLSPTMHTLKLVFIPLFLRFFFSNLLILVPKNFIQTLKYSAHVLHLCLYSVFSFISFILLKIFNFFAHSNETLNILLIFLDPFSFSSTSSYSFMFSPRNIIQTSHQSPPFVLYHIGSTFSYLSCSFQTFTGDSNCLKL